MSFNAVQPVELRFDIEKLKESVGNLILQSPFFHSTHQISLKFRGSQTHQDPVTLLQDGVGSLFDFEKRKWLGKESDFNSNNPLVAGTYLESVISEVTKFSPVGLGRVRIMRMAPKTCYSWHWDPDPFRWHIPVITNDACFYLTKEGGMEQMLDVGRLYKVNTAVNHTAANCSGVDRIHLVFSCWSQETFRGKI